jgi:hypothetical protein
VDIWELFPDPLFDQHTITDNAGYYQMDVPDAAIVHFTVSASGFITGTQEVSPDGSSSVAQDFALAVAGSVSGTIHASTHDGPVLADVTVSLLDATTQEILDQVSTDAEGRYAFRDLLSGSYGICVFDAQDIYIDSCYDAKTVAADGTISLTPVNLANGDGLSGIDMSLSVGATLSGQLSDSYFGTPISNAAMELTLYSPSEKQVAKLTANTDANGGFTIAGLAAGSYYLEAGAHFRSYNTNAAYTLRLYGGGECALPSGQSPSCPFASGTLINVPASGISGIDFSLFPGYVVKGKVADADTGVGIANVTIKVCDNPSVFLYGISGSTTTDANGNYTIAHAVGVHTYISATQAPGHLSVIWPSTPTQPSGDCIGPEHSAAQQLEFTQPDQELTGVNFNLQAGASISGTVTASDLAGEPLAASLNLYASDGQSLQWLASLQSNSSGNFMTPGLDAGTYYLAAYYDNCADCQMFSASDCGAWNPYDPLSFDASTATAIELTTGQAETGIVLQLKGDIFHDGFQ